MLLSLQEHLIIFLLGVKPHLAKASQCEPVGRHLTMMPVDPEIPVNNPTVIRQALNVR